MRRLFRPHFLKAIPLLLVFTIAAAPQFGVANWLATKPEPPPSPNPSVAMTELVLGRPDTLRLPADVARRLGVQTAKVEKATRPRLLTLAGSLALDANRLARVHARFGGEVVEIGTV